MYIFLIILGYILPLTLLIIGLIFSKYPPKNINSISGYRTTRSMMSIDTWNEANLYSSQLLFKYALSLLSLTTIVLIFAYKSYKYIAIIDFSSVIIGVILVIVTVFKTENHLKKVFKIE